MNTLEAALEYLEMGWSVIPLHGKKPAVLPNGRAFSWARYQTVRAFPSHVHKWHSDGLLQNVGIVCGAVSDNLVVVDLDGESAVGAFYSTWTKLCQTYTVVTGSGRGVHLYYGVKKLPPTTRIMGRKGNIEVRANGCYIAAPPSVHPDTGARYELAGPDELTTLPDLDDLVTWLKSLTPGKPPTPARTFLRRTIGVGWAARALQYEARDVAAATEGNRNTRLNVAAYNLGQIVGDGLLSRSEVESALLSAAVAAGQSEREAAATIASGLEAGIEQPRSQQWARR